MRADNTHHLTEASRRRSQATRRRAVAALRCMDTSGLPITIDAIAREAGVSRSWIYSQPDLRAEAGRLRDRPRPATGGAAVPDRQRTSDASLLRRVEVATQRIRELEADNKRLRAALAEALGERRLTPAGALAAGRIHEGCRVSGHRSIQRRVTLAARGRARRQCGIGRTTSC
jgi:hypothetical protein